MSQELPSPRGPASGVPAIANGSEPSAELRAFEAGALPEEPGTPSIRRYVAAVLRFKWLVLAGTLLGLAGGVAAGRMLPKMYSAEAKLWVAQPDRENRGPIQASELMSASGWVELLRSYRVLDYAVTEHRLFLSPRTEEARRALQSFVLQDRFVPGEYRLTVDATGASYQLATGAGALVETGRVGEPVGAAIGFDWAPDTTVLQPSQVVEFTVVTPRDVARQLGETLRVIPDRQNTFLNVELVGRDPAQTAAILNTLVDRFVDVAATLKRAGLDERATILEEQRAIAQANLQAAEMALETFKVRTITLPSDRAAPVPGGLQITNDPVFASFFQLRLDQERLRQDRDAIDRVLQVSRDSSGAISALEFIEPIRQTSEIMRALADLTERRSELRVALATYTEQHPSVLRLTAEIQGLEQQTLPQLAMRVRQELDARDRELTRLINATSGELAAVPPRMIQEAGLERDVAAAAGLYAELSSRSEEARLGAASSVPDVRVLDPAAVPQRPTSDNSQRVLLMAVLAGFGISLLGAVVLDRVDPRLRYPEQVTDELGLSILGAVPFVRARNGRTDADTSHQALEAFRSIRMNLVYAHGAAGPVMLTITSPGVGDGKSFISSNLAQAFADVRQRTLLIDADVRRGTQHRNFGAKRQGGLTDLLAGRITIEDAIRTTRVEGLDLIPSGMRRQDGPELLGSAKMRELLHYARTRYDVIIVDSPPLGAGVDPFLLGTLTGAIAMVLRTGNTNREMATAKLAMLDRLPVRMLGAVLNGIPNDQAVYRYYSYISGYEVTDESDSGRSLAALTGIRPAEPAGK